MADASLVHIAVAQFQPRKGHYHHNLARVGELFAQLQAAPAHPNPAAASRETPPARPTVLVLPEVALTGYFLEGGVAEHALTAGTLAADLQATYKAKVPGSPTLDIVIGFYERWRNAIHNSALYVTLGADAPTIRHVHRKIFLPTYGLFDEQRFVQSGQDLRAFDTPWGRAAILICEDAWHGLSGTLAALDGAQILFICSAAPARGPWAADGDERGQPATVSRWDRLIRGISEEHGVYTVLANLTGSEGGKVFPGAARIFGPAGHLEAAGPLWDEAVVTTSLDLDALTRARATSPLLGDLRVAMPHLLTNLSRVTTDVPQESAYDPATRTPFSPKREPLSAREHSSDHVPVVENAELGTGPAPLEIDPAVLTEWLVHFIRLEMRTRGLTMGVVGLSGGVDSAVTAFLAARALGPDHVLGVRMPYRTSSSDSLDHARLITQALAIREHTVDISPAVDGYLATDTDTDPTRRGNVMARMRMITLFDLAAKHRGIPLGTGNKTERLLGYFTWHADDSPPLNPIGDLFKTQVWALARHLGVPDPIVAKPPTADLVAGQTDEGDLGISYQKADEILNWLVSGYSAADLVARGFDPKEVALIERRLAGTHWKRRLPTVAMVSPTAIGESYLRPVDY